MIRGYSHVLLALIVNKLTGYIFTYENFLLEKAESELLETGSGLDFLC